jgi:sirohydrochlorin cobaltochelatase
MRLVLLVAHGSRDPRWRQPFEALLQWAQGQPDAETHPVALAYMEMAEPNVLQAVEKALGQYPAIQAIDVLPLLMAAGAHFANEIQEETTALSQRWPHLAITLAQPAGEHPLLQAALKALITEAREAGIASNIETSA